MNRRQPETLSSSRLEATSALLLFPLGLFPPITDAYREVLTTRPYFFLREWRWYEWLGIFAPLALLGLIRWLARSQDLPVLEAMCSASVVSGLVFFCVSLTITIPQRLANFAELQPMRGLHLIYILLFVFLGGLVAQWVLRDHIWRWAVLFLPLSSGMWYAQRQLFPATPHVEWPGAKPKNDWVQALLWIRQNAPREAYFALDPDYMALAGEDQHGFRAIAERSRLADVVKDSGAVTMFPALAETWRQQVRAQRRWKDFQLSDFPGLQQKFGVDWVVLQRPGVMGLPCPYQNNAVLVCRLE